MSDLFPHGVFSAALTPVTVDFSPGLPAMAAHWRWLLEEGCDGIALLGTTGEANSFSAPECMRLLKGVIGAFMARPETVQKFQELGAIPIATSPEAFARHITAETERWKGVIETAGIKSE